MYIPRLGLPTFMKKTVSKIDVRALLRETEDDAGFIFPEILAQSTHTHAGITGTISAGHTLGLSDMQRAIETLSAARRSDDFISGRWEGMDGFASAEGINQLQQYYAAAAARNDDHIRATMSLSYD